MKDMILICLMLGIIVFGFFLMKRVDDFFEENQRLIEKEQIGKGKLIHIAAEMPMLLCPMAYALGYYSDSDPEVEFAVSSGSAGKLLKDLKDGDVDFVLLRESTAGRACADFPHIVIPCGFRPIAGESAKGPEETTNENNRICVLWNQSVSSGTRDMVLGVLKNAA